MNKLLDLYPAQAQPTSPIRPLGNAGGGSGASLWRFDSGLGKLMIRAWPVDGPGLSALTHIHGWLAPLATLGFIPIPIPTRDGRTFVSLDGRSWEVTPWMPGVADLDRPPTPSHLRAAFSGLAALHQRWSIAARIGWSHALADRLDEAESLIAMELGLMAFAVAHAPSDPVRGLAERWLGMAREGLVAMVDRLRRDGSIELPLQPVLRDARPEHFLFEGDRLTGLVDFGAMGVDSPSVDLARLLSEWVGTDRVARHQALDAYNAVRPLSTREVEAIDIFTESAAWLGPARWVRWHYIERRPFTDSDAVHRGLERSLARLLERLAPIMSSTP